MCRCFHIPPVIGRKKQEMRLFAVRRATRSSPARSVIVASEMKVVLQRVSGASVRVSGTKRGVIGPGLLVLVGVADGDTDEEATRLAGKVARLRVFEDDAGRFDRSLLDTGGSALVVSQFTLLADTGKGNRPSFGGAAPPELAEPLYESFCDALRGLGVQVETGVFGARMEVELVNDGPVTIVL
jgi:D-aminoacyl-tRNA deacylase